MIGDKGEFMFFLWKLWKFYEKYDFYMNWNKKLSKT